jgi:LmbE family N-acetylglucosaminyl deacetylase
MLEYLKNKKIMIIVAHPDDEIIGIGATINKLTNECNCDVKCLILGEGITSRDTSRDRKGRAKDLEKHQENIISAQKIIGYSDLSTYNFPDNRFDTIPLLDIIKVIENEKRIFSPDIIFTHHGGDLNIDHQITNRAVITATRPLEDETVKSIITFETFSGTEWQASNHPEKFSPNFFISLNKNQIDLKIQAMESYFFEKRIFPHPRSPESILNRSKFWGSTIGTQYSEAFQIIRMIN